MITCRLKEIIDEEEISVRWLSLRCGVSVRSLYRYINEERIPDLLIASKIAESLGVGIEDIWRFY